MIEIAEGINKLKTLKSDGKLILFVGSGISVPAPSNLPTWEGFLDDFISFCKKTEIKYRNHILTPIFTTELVTAAESAKTKYPAEVASVLKNKLMELPDMIKTNVTNDYKAWFTLFFGNKEPNDFHKLIVKADYKYILTSNYDALLEDAAIENGQLYNSISFHESAHLAQTVYLDEPAIIHIHGKFSDIAIDKTIFTSEDYFKIIKKQYPAFTFTMHSLLMRYSTLFVGYGASDPHLEDLLEEFATYFDYKEQYRLPQNYLVLRRDKVNLIKNEHKKRIGTEIIVIDDYNAYTQLFENLIN